MPSAGPCHTALRCARVAPAVLVVLLALLTLPGLATAAPGPGAGGPLPLAFEANHGQADGSVKFLTRGRGYGLFLTPAETVLVLVPGDLRSPLGRRPGPDPGGGSVPPSVVRMRFVGGDASAAIVGGRPLPGRSHYFLGEPGRWRRDVPTSRACTTQACTPA